MNKRPTYRTLLAGLLLCMAAVLALAAKREQKKKIYMAERPLVTIPAYADSLVLPPNIAPLGFTAADPNWRIAAVRFSAFARGAADAATGAAASDTALPVAQIVFEPWPEQFGAEHLRPWHQLLAAARGGLIRVEITAHPDGRPDSLCHFPPLCWFIADEPIDPYIIYRTSIFEDASYHHLVIEQKNLETFETVPLLDNFLMNNNCMNCHACEDNNINNFIVHLRGRLTGTLLARDGELTKLKIPDSHPGLRLVYPSWYPGGDFIAFSTNQVYSQHFSTPRRKGLVTVDTLGDIVVLDTKTLELFSCDELTTDEYDDVFPCFSTDGRKLFFCRAPARGTEAEKRALAKVRTQARHSPADSLFFRSGEQLAYWLNVSDERIEKANALRADLMQIDFDPETRRFSNLRTVVRFSEMNLSATMPYASPNGQYLVVSALPTTTFSVQVMGDLYKIYLHDSTPSGMVPAGVECGYRVEPIHRLNTDGSETFHTFSRDGHWMVFASNRETFGIPELYISHVSDEGRFAPPFILPQRETDFYARNLRAFLFPFLSTEAAKFDAQKTAEAAHGASVELKVIDLDKYRTAARPATESGH